MTKSEFAAAISVKTVALPNIFIFIFLNYKYFVTVRPLSCVSCVTASCFPYMVSFLSSFMSLLVNSVPGVCLWLC